MPKKKQNKVNEISEAIADLLDKKCQGLSTEDYLEALETVASDMEGRIMALKEENGLE